MEDFSEKKLFARLHKFEKHEATLETFQRAPIQLVKIGKRGQVKLCPDGENYLKRIIGKIALVGVFGPYHSGKKLLLNLLINGNGSGFEYSDKTEGIWIWGEPLATKDCNILFLDCENTKTVERSTASDVQILALMILLTSVLIYNTKGGIDEQCINQLASATCFNEIIDFRNGLSDSPDEINERIAAEAPQFVWVLRDFILNLVDDNGNYVSSKEYMENLLNMQGFMGKNGKKNWEIRKMVVELFKQRDCVALPRPVASEKDFERLESLNFADLLPKFQKIFEKFKLNLLEFCPTKKINGTEASGFQISILLKNCIRIMNAGEVPNLYNTWHQAIRVQYEETLNRAKDNYMETKEIDPTLMPYEELELLEKLQKAKDNSLLLLSQIPNRNPILDIEAFENFQEFYSKDLEFTKAANQAASEAYNISVIEKIYRPILVKIDEDIYAGEFEEMETEWIKALKQYEKEAKGPGKFIAISEFSRRHQHPAFYKFFQEILEKYKEEIEELRTKDREYKQRVKAQEKDEERWKIISEHVKTNQVQGLKQDLQIEDRELGPLFKKIEAEVRKKL